MASFLQGPQGVHNTQKIKKHKLKRGLTRDLNAAAGALVNTKNPHGIEAFRYAAKAKAKELTELALKTINACDISGKDKLMDLAKYLISRQN